MLRPAVLVALALCLPTAARAEPVPHRAEYALRLGQAANAPRIGEATHDLAADCGGWKLRRDIASEIALTAQWKLSVGSKLDAEESRGGSSLRYRATQFQNGAERTSRGRVERTPAETRAEIAGGQGAQQIVLPPGTLLPVAGIAHLVERLRAGVTSFPALMFDAEVISDAFLVEANLLDGVRARRPVDRDLLPRGMRAWPVHLSFTRGRFQDQRPLFAVSALVYENGVLDRLTVDTGLVSVTADLQTLDLRPMPSCPRS